MSFYELIVHAVEDSIKSLNAIWKVTKYYKKKLGLTESERENQNILFRKHLDEFLLVELEQAKIEFNKKKEALSAQQKQCIDIAERLEESIDSFYHGEDKIEEILNSEDKSINDKLNAFQPMLERLVEKEASLKVLFQQNRNELLKMQEKFGDLNATNKSVFDCNKPVSKKLLKELLERKQLISKKIVFSLYFRRKKKKKVLKFWPKRFATNLNEIY
ncbi:hypothetical protein MHBO_000061 [Bonamia ostreae]|uniref:Uncharacterized protein n=1 Tax=Bonamia ostreae TaxID=126728 RepID=A0ABV2AEC1_9EUKA